MQATEDLKENVEQHSFVNSFKVRSKRRGRNGGMEWQKKSAILRAHLQTHTETFMPIQLTYGNGLWKLFRCQPSVSSIGRTKTQRIIVIIVRTFFFLLLLLALLLAAIHIENTLCRVIHQPQCQSDSNGAIHFTHAEE